MHFLASDCVTLVGFEFSREEHYSSAVLTPIPSFLSGHFPGGELLARLCLHHENSNQPLSELYLHKVFWCVVKKLTSTA